MITVEGYDEMAAELAKANHLTAEQAEEAMAFIGDTPEFNEAGQVKAVIGDVTLWLLWPWDEV